MRKMDTQTTMLKYMTAKQYSPNMLEKAIPVRSIKAQKTSKGPVINSSVLKGNEAMSHR